MLCDEVEWTRIQYIRCQQLLNSTILCNDKKSFVNNIIVKIICYTKDRVTILGFVNMMIELTFIISFITFSNHTEEFIGGLFQSYKRKDSLQKLMIYKFNKYYH